MTRITNKTSRAMTTPITEAIETGSEKKVVEIRQYIFFFFFAVQYHIKCILHVFWGILIARLNSSL